MMRRTVRDRSGTHYILEKRGTASSRVRRPATGERLHLPNEALEPVTDESPLETVLSPLPADAVERIDGVADRRALGLLVEIDASGPTGVRTLLDRLDLCESDLHGRLAEMQAAGLLTEVSVGGERGYRTTETGAKRLSSLD